MKSLPATRFLLATVALSIAPALAQDHDLVILNGRVMDPEPKLDAVQNVGVTTAMKLEIGVLPVNAWHEKLEGRSQTSFDATVDTISGKWS